MKMCPSFSALQSRDRGMQPLQRADDLQAALFWEEPALLRSEGVGVRPPSQRVLERNGRGSTRGRGAGGSREQRRGGPSKPQGRRQFPSLPQVGGQGPSL